MSAVELLSVSHDPVFTQEPDPEIEIETEADIMLEAPGVNWKSAIPEMRVMNMWE
jgi:hypothetical protein